MEQPENEDLYSSVPLHEFVSESFPGECHGDDDRENHHEDDEDDGEKEDAGDQEGDVHTAENEGPGDHNNDNEEEDVPASRSNSERTASTNTTVFSASSLPSLEGIDMVAVARASYSSLPSTNHEGVDRDVGHEDGHPTMDSGPSTVVTNDASHVDAAAAFLQVDYEETTSTGPLAHEAASVFDMAPSPLAAAPKLPSVPYGGQRSPGSTVRDSRGRRPGPTTWWRDDAPESVTAHLASPGHRPWKASSSTPSKTNNVDLSHQKTDARKRKRARRVGSLGSAKGKDEGMEVRPLVAATRAPDPVICSTVDSSSAPKSDEMATRADQSSVEASSDATVSGLIPAHLQHQSKHDEKWFHMLEQLIRYKNEHGDTLVPQHFDENPRLGRWVHYQRVEYWIFQEKGKAKINADRIRRLDNVGFEWDPQKVQWRAMYDKLTAFYREHGHSKVPKGYRKDPELANWVRNQRLEQANFERQKRSRMTPERHALLDKLDFAWSKPAPPSKRRASNTTTDEPPGLDDDGDSRLDPLPFGLHDHPRI